jgi:hypothetical protein
MLEKLQMVYQGEKFQTTNKIINMFIIVKNSGDKHDNNHVWHREKL